MDIGEGDTMNWHDVVPSVIFITSAALFVSEVYRYIWGRLFTYIRVKYEWSNGDVYLVDYFMLDYIRLAVGFGARGPGDRRLRIFFGKETR